MLHLLISLVFFFFNDTATTEIYTLSLHDALPISDEGFRETDFGAWEGLTFAEVRERWPSELTTWLADPSVAPPGGDRKSTRLNSSHSQISYAVFCLKKKTIHTTRHHL